MPMEERDPIEHEELDEQEEEDLIEEGEGEEGDQKAAHSRSSRAGLLVCLFAAFHSRCLTCGTDFALRSSLSAVSTVT